MGGSAGGGGGSQYPEYLSGTHRLWLNHTLDGSPPDVPNYSMTDLMNTAWGWNGNPWNSATHFNPGADLGVIFNAAETAIGKLDTLNAILNDLSVEKYDPTADKALLNDCINAMAAIVDDIDAAVGNLESELFNLDLLASWQVAINTVRTIIDATIVTDVFINADIQSFSDLLDDNINITVLPQFRASMRTVNAVHSSAFVIGESIIYGMHNRDVAKYASGLRLDMHKQRNQMIMQSVELVLRLMMDKYQLLTKLIDAMVEAGKIRAALCTTRMDVMRINVLLDSTGLEIAQFNLAVRQAQAGIQTNKADLRRLGIIASTDYYKNLISVAEGAAKWPFEVYQYGANLMAAVQGGVVHNPDRQPSTFSSAMGGALGGAAIGGQITNTGYGAGIGAIIGGLGGLLNR
jgi:hypothetical protein